jgi:hypothetical protein
VTAVLAVIARLEMVSALTALVSTRIYQGILPQGGLLPALRVQRVSENQPMHTRGSVSVFATRVQIDAVSDSVDVALNVDAVLYGDGAGSALVGFRGSAGGVLVQGIFPAGAREGYDGAELRQYKVMRDVMVRWSPT